MNLAYIEGYTGQVIYIINDVLVPLLMAVAFIVFLWGVYGYFIAGASDPKKREEGKPFVFWGIAGFVIIISVWGLVYILQATLGLTTGSAPAVPTLNVSP